MNTRLAAWRLLCNILAPRQDPESISRLTRDIQIQRENWVQVIRFADAHLMSPAVWGALQRKGIVAYVPDEARQYLASLYEMNAKRNASLLNQLDEAIRILNRQGVVPLLMKGAAYLKTKIYGDPAERIFADLDLLFDEAEIPLALDALHSCGYRTAPGKGMDYSQHRHCPPLFRPGEYGAIEIHRQLLERRLTAILPEHVALQAAFEMRDEDMAYRHLSPSHSLVLSFLHSQIIDGLGETFTIAFRPMQDLRALTTTYQDRIEWKTIDALLKKHALEKRFSDYLFAAWHELGFSARPGVRFGAREWGHYAIAHARIRWSRIERLSLWEFSSDWIRRQHGEDQGSFALNCHRLGLVREIVRRRTRMALSMFNSP